MSDRTEGTPALHELEMESPQTRAADARRATFATLMLVVACLFWGYSFPTMQMATHAFDRHAMRGDETEAGQIVASRSLFNAIRFVLAAGVFALLTWPKQRGFSRNELLGGFVIGVLFGLAMIFQVTGLLWALPSVSGFLTALAVVFAPLAQAVLLRRRVSPATWVAVGLAIVGMLFLSWPKETAHAANTLARTAPVPYLGEILTALASMIFTAEILVLDHTGRKPGVDPVRVTFIMLAAAAVVNIASAVVCDRAMVFRPAVWSGIATDRTIWWTLATLTLLSSVVSLYLMTAYQPVLSPATASVIYCTEPLFAVMFSLLFMTESLTWTTVAGGIAVTGAVLVIARRTGG